MAITHTPHITMHVHKIIRSTVGADLSCPSPIYRPRANLSRPLLSLCLVLSLLLGAIVSLPSIAYADGGAPNLAYIAGAAHGIAVIDIAQQKVTSSFSIGGDPHAIYLSLDGRFLYVTQPALGRVSMLAARTGQVICSANVSGQPSLLALDPGTNILYTAGNGSSIITGLDPNTCAVKRTINARGPVYGLAIAVVGAGTNGGNGNQLWVTSTASLTVFGNTGQLFSISIPDGPQYITIPPGTTVYVTTRQGSVDAVDLNSRQLVPHLITGGTFGPMDYDAITGEVYVPDMRNNSLDVLTPLLSGDTNLPHEPARVYHLGVAPQAIAVTSDGQLGFIALAGGKVAMLDIPGRQIVNTILVGGTPHFIITGLYPPAVGTTPQQAATWGTVINIAAYALVIALFIVPFLIFRRYTRAANGKKDKQKL